MSISTHTKDLDELLDHINNTQDSVALVDKLKWYNNNVPYFRQYMIMATDEKWTSFDASATVYSMHGYHRSFSGMRLLNRHTVNQVDLIIRNGNAETAQKKLREMLEALYEGEARVLIAILSKNLVALYPNITHEAVSNSLT